MRTTINIIHYGPLSLIFELPFCFLEIEHFSPFFFSEKDVTIVASASLGIGLQVGDLVL